MKIIQVNRLWGVVFGVLLSFGNVPALPSSALSTVPLHAAASSIGGAAELPACEQSGGTGGLAAGSHEVIIAGRPAHVIISSLYDPAEPTYLAFYLHGSEGGYKRNQPLSSKVRQFIEEAGWIYVAPQAPADINFPDAHPWHVDGDPGPRTQANEQLVIDVFEHMYANYNVCKNVLFGSSVSSGSHFYDRLFFPRYGDRYPAFMNIGCGAGHLNSSTPAYQNALLLSQNPDIIARSELHYTIGTEDFLYDDYLVSSATYQSLGFSVTSDVLKGVDHCAFDSSEKTATYWQQKSSATLNPSPDFLLSSDSLSQEAEVGLQTTIIYDLSISSATSNALIWTATETIAWLTLAATEGATPGTIRATISTGHLSAGTYTGTIEITTRVSGTTSETPRTSVQSVPVTLVVKPNGEPTQQTVDIYLPLMVVDSQ